MLLVFVMALLPCTLAGPVFDGNLVAQLQTRLDQGESSETVFQDFKTVFRKKYDSDDEEKLRLQIFQANVDFIHQHNLLYAKGDKSYTLGVNQFTDMTHEEFLLQYTTRYPMERPGNGSLFLAPSNVHVPSSVDWRDKGLVTPVKNQGQCGSCWAFSTTGSLEGQVAKATGHLVSLSEQQLVDCSTKNQGCNGGWKDVAFSYIKSAGGLEREQDYPYTAREGACTFNKGKVVAGSAVSGLISIRSGSETDLQQAVASVGPISISIEVMPSFQHYNGGVYYESKCSARIHNNHAVLAVGYGADTDREYWIVKNSWGATWGESGYIRMARNKDNNCGVASNAVYPLLSKC